MTVDKYGPWAVVVGGSEGVGASFARQLAATGLNLVLVARKVETIQQLAAEIRLNSDVEIRCVSLDVTWPDMHLQLSDATADIDVGLLIYNVGSVAPAPFLDTELDTLIATVNLNSVGQLRLAHVFGRRMRDRRRGGIILIGSMAGVAGGAGTAVYSGAKAFTHILAEALWAELKPHGIDVLGFILGATRTPYLERSGLLLDGAADPDEVARQALASIADGPIDTPDELRQQFKVLTSWDRRTAAEVMSAGVAAMGTVTSA